MNVCDQAGCTAWGIREVSFDNGCSLYLCSHHAAHAFPWMTPECRFDMEPSEIHV